MKNGTEDMTNKVSYGETGCKKQYQEKQARWEYIHYIVSLMLKPEDCT